jgi:hypothetical protein
MAENQRNRPVEAPLDELLADCIMRPVLRSAGYDRDRFYDLLVETAQRVKQALKREGCFGVELFAL